MKSRRELCPNLLNCKGNYYSFANTHEFDARLFFTQGCVPTENENLASEPASKPTAMEGDSATDAGRPTKGRPKGSKSAKQKAGGKPRAS